MTRVVFFASIAIASSRRTGGLDQVENLLEDFQTKLTSEGAEAAKVYEEQACSCGDFTDQLNSDIDRDSGLHTGENSARDEAQTEITILTADKGEEGSIAWTKNEIATTKAIKAAEITARKSFVADSLRKIGQADEAITLIESAKKALATGGQKVSSIQSFTQLQSKLHSLGVAFNAGPTAHNTDHSFVKKMLNDLLTDVTKQKQSDAKAMNLRKHDSALLVDEYDAALASSNEQLDRRNEKLAEEQTKAAEAEQKMHALQLNLENNQRVLQETTERCTNIKSEYDADTKNRMAELQVISQALRVIKARNTESSTPDATAPNVALQESVQECSLNLASPAGFLQRRSRYVFPSVNLSTSLPDYTSAIEEIRSRNTKSTVLLTVMNAMTRNDTMENVRQMIRDLIQKLKDEEQNDLTRNEQCTRREEDLVNKKKTAKTQLVKYESELEEAQADIADAKAKIKKLNEEDAEIRQNCNDMKTEYVAERGLQEKSQQVATDGRKVLEDTLLVLEQHFGEAAQADMKSGYTGDLDAAAGITGMIQTLINDFSKTIEDSTHEIENLNTDITNLETKTSDAVRSKINERRAVESDELATAENEVARSTESLKQAVGAFSTNTQQLVFLKTESPECATSTLSKEALTANKMAEIDALKDVLDILNNHGSN